MNCWRLVKAPIRATMAQTTPTTIATRCNRRSGAGWVSKSVIFLSSPLVRLARLGAGSGDIRVDALGVAQFQRPDISDNRPSIGGANAIAIAVHRAVAVADHVVKVPDGCVAQAFRVIARRLGEAA